MSKSTNPLIRMFKGLWGFIDSARKVTFNLLFLIIAIALIGAAFSSGDPEIADKTEIGRASCRERVYAPV